MTPNSTSPVNLATFQFRKRAQKLVEKSHLISVLALKATDGVVYWVENSLHKTKDRAVK